MAKVKWVQIRNGIAFIFAIVVVIVFLAALSVVFDWNVPLIRDLGNALPLE